MERGFCAQYYSAFCATWPLKIGLEREFVWIYYENGHYGIILALHEYQLKQDVLIVATSAAGITLRNIVLPLATICTGMIMHTRA